MKPLLRFDGVALRRGGRLLFENLDLALDPGEAAPARTGLALFNDAILRAAFDARAAVIELRSLCTAPEDYANPIEPSGAGGRKIAAAVTRAVGAVETALRPSRVWA